MDSSLAAIDYVRRLQGRKVLQPQAGGLGFPVSKLPRLDDLVGLSDSAGDYADGVLDGNARDIRSHEVTNKVERKALLRFTLLEPACPTYSQESTGRMCDHGVPSGMERAKHVALYMRPRFLSRQQVTRPRIVASGAEGVTHRSTELTRDKDFHSTTPLR